MPVNDSFSRARSNEELKEHRASLRSLLGKASELAAAVVLEQKPPSCHAFLFVHRLFLEFNCELQSYLDVEETAFQPALRGRRDAGQQPCGLAEAVRLLRCGQEQILCLVSDMCEATHGFETPADGCACYVALVDVLRALQTELLQHFRLENEELFPAVLGLSASPLR